MKKNNFFNKLLIRKFIYFFVLYFGVSFSAFAEGTKQTTPYNATTGAEIQLQINRTATGGAASLFAGWTATSVNDRMYIRINDYTTEKVYLGFRKETSSQDVRFRIKRPDGTVVYGPTAIPTSGAGYIDTWAQANIGPSNLTGNTGGYQAIVFDPNVNANSRVNGDFYIEFNVGTSANTTQIFLRYYDITVANGTANTNVINGRLWSYNWGFNSGSFNSNGYFGSLYSYTTDSIVTEIDLNGVRPYYFRIHNNSTGPRNNLTLQENRKSVEGLYENPEYKLFLNEPDINVFPSKKNPVVNVVYNGISGCGNSYCINLSVDNSALAYIMLDVNNDGDYIDAVDRILEQSVVGGVNCILWDGKDGLGADVVNGTQFKIEVSTQQGTTHLPIYDAENHPNGYLARLVRPLGIGTVYMYYDNSSLATKGGVTSSSNLFGTTPPTPLTGNTVNTNGINKWNTTSGSIYYGDERTINTWWSIRKSAYVGLTINKPYCADLSVTITDGVIQYVPNSTLTYTVVVSNAGPNAVPGATFTNNAPVGTTITSWTATGTSGTVYTASGSGNINQTLTIPVGGTITYTVTVSVPSTVTGNLVNTANISAPSDYSDPNLSNNTASDTDVEKPIAENDINQTPQDTPVSGQLMTNDEGITSISGVTIGGSPFILGTPKTVSGIDRNGNPVTNAGSLVINANGTYTFTPATGFTGLINPVTYTGLGANGSSDTADLTIEVLPKLVPGNNPPVAQNDVNTTEMNTSISSSVLPNDSDPDGDVLSVISSSLSIGIPTQVSGVSNLGVNVPNAGTVTLNPNGTYTYLPTTGFIGTVNDITYTISDGNGGIDSAVLSINVVGNSGNNTFANDDANSAPQGTTMTGNVLTNDFDPEGNTQTVSTASATYNGSTTTITIDTSTEIPNVGSLTLNSNGTYTFVPLSTFVGTVPVIYNKCDNGTPQACDEATLYLTSIPKAVIAENDINQTPQDTPVSGQLMTNDEGVTSVTGATIGGSPFTLGTAKQVAGVDRNGNPVTNAGSLVINANGTYTFTPATGFVGTINPVTYTGAGTNGGTDTAILSIEVLPVLVPGNNPPVAQNDVNTTEVNVTISSGVLPNDSDPDGDVLTVTSVLTGVQVAGKDSYGNAVANAGTITLNANGTYTYVPATGFIGTVNDITYTISDGKGGTDSAILSISVIGNNGNNTFANDDANSAPQGTTMTGNILTNDFDPEGNTQTVTVAVADGTPLIIGSSTTITGVGSLSLNENGSYTFDPLASFTGTVVVPYTVCDNGTPQACDFATLYLTSLPPANDFCAWATTADANDWAADIWEGLDCATNTWIYSPTPPTNDRPTYIRHTVEIPVGSNIVSDSLFIQPNGRLKVCGTLEIDNQIVFEVDSTGRAGQLDNSCGSTSCTVDVRSTASIIVRKKFGKNIYPWNFVSFPFNVVEDSIFIGGTRTKAVWGDIQDNVADFFIAEYDGQRRANYGVSNGSNYVNVPNHLLLANKGYILAGGDGIDSIDFKSAIGTDFLCGPIMVPTSINVSSTGRSYCDEGWNLVGVPYVTGYNLNNAWPFDPYFVWNGVDNYTTVMADDDFYVYPFSSFFIQDWLQAYDGLTYDIDGKTFKAVKAANKYDEISLTVSNSQNSDLTRIRLKEDALVSFERKNDGIKLMSPVMSVPQIYTEAQGSCAGLACNALPLNTERVDLKVRTGKAGTYKIAMVNKEKLKDVIRVMLVDTETKAQTNLMEQSYTFDITTSTTAITSRFYVVITSQDINGTDVVIGNGIRVYTAGNEVYLTGLNGKAGVNIFDAAGKLIYQFQNVENNLPFTINVPGMYIMDINTENGNARTKLIINNK